MAHLGLARVLFRLAKSKRLDFFPGMAKKEKLF